jgi:hypothetical protein
LGGTGEIADRVLLEAGTASGREPTTVVELRSYLGQFFEETKPSLGADDKEGFSLCLLYFCRTFVEKMFVIHSQVEILKRDERSRGHGWNASPEEGKPCAGSDLLSESS